MTRYADPSVCPDCSTRLEGSPVVCPGCRLPLHHPLTAELFSTLTHADNLLGQLRALVPAVPITAPVPTGSFIPPVPPMPASSPTRDAPACDRPPCPPSCSASAPRASWWPR